MDPALAAAILAYFQADTQLSTLVTGGEKISYALLPPTYPSVTMHLDSEHGMPRAGYTAGNYVRDFDVQMAFHIYSHDEGQIVGTAPAQVSYDAVSLHMAISDRVNVLAIMIATVAGITAITQLRDVDYSSRMLPFEEDTHVHHTSGLLRFTYARVDTP